jgi:hypothetical protein
MNRKNIYGVSVFAIFLLVLGSDFDVHAQKSNVMTFKERETERMIEAQRKAGFSDIEIDTLHESIAANLAEIRRINELGVDKQAAMYLTDVPASSSEIFKADKEGKLFVQFQLPQGQSYTDWPKVYLYDGVGFLYPSADFRSLDKIVLMFRRVNADGQVYIKEMRRLINPSPKGSTRREDGSTEVDSNSDIQLEYYQSLTSNTIWPDAPIQEMQPNVVMELNNSENPLPYEKQKLIMGQYKKVLRKVDKEIAQKLRGLTLDQKRMITKMLEYK